MKKIEQKIEYNDEEAVFFEKYKFLLLLAMIIIFLHYLYGGYWILLLFPIIAYLTIKYNDYKYDEYPYCGEELDKKPHEYCPYCHAPLRKMEEKQ